MPIRLVRSIAAAVLIAVLAAGCGSDDEQAAADPTPTAITPTETAVPDTPVPDTPVPDTPVPVTPTPEPTAEPEPTATPAPLQPTPLATSPPDLPGGDWDLYVPERGEILSVVGVQYDDILEVHEVPGENSPLVANLPPLADDVVSAGEGRQLPLSIWWRITWGPVDGWVGARFMSRLGVTVDVTSQVVDDLGEIPTGETMLDLGMAVAETRASEDPPSNVVVSAAPTVGDLGEITIDVVGLGDDAVKGERLVIFGTPAERGEGFSLKSVEATVMCDRGVTEEGLCI